MIFLGELERVEDNKYKVGIIHYMPFDNKYGLGLSEQELESAGILVDTVPEPEQVSGKCHVLYCNTITKELWYEYKDIPPTQEELDKQKIERLESEILGLQMAMAELTMMMSTPQ